MNATVWPLRIVARRLLRPTQTARVLGAALSVAGIVLAYSLATGPTPLTALSGAPLETTPEASTAAARAESSQAPRSSNVVPSAAASAADGVVRTAPLNAVAGMNAGQPMRRGVHVAAGVTQRARAGTAGEPGEPDDEGSTDLPIQTHASRDDVGSAATIGGRPLEPVPRVPDEVLNITNVGDRIVVSRHAPGTPIVTAVQPRSAPAETDTDNSGGGDEQTDAGTTQRPDYEDVYPGCPSALPEGADAQMALQRQRDYGCLYYESCAISEESPPPCRWYLIKKL